MFATSYPHFIANDMCFDRAIKRARPHHASKFFLPTFRNGFPPARVPSGDAFASISAP
jgi:hypothetical protein